MLAKHKIKSDALPPRKIFSYLPPVKEALGLRTPGTYSIPFECAGFILDKAVDPSSSESKTTIDI